MTLHLQFPRRTEVGPAKFLIKDVKLGRQTSTIHMSLVQHGKEVVIGYLNHTNIAKENGVSFETNWELTPPPYAVDLKALRAGNDANWIEQTEMPFASFRKASNRVRFFFPRQGQKVKSLSDQWLTFRNGEKFTDESLGYVFGNQLWTEYLRILTIITATSQTCFPSSLKASLPKRYPVLYD